MELSIIYLPDAFKRFLKLDSESQEAHKSKRFPKVRGILKLYLTDLIKVLKTNPSFISHIECQHINDFTLSTVVAKRGISQHPHGTLETSSPNVALYPIVFDLD
jgi:hypothetical protein